MNVCLYIQLRGGQSCMSNSWVKTYRKNIKEGLATYFEAVVRQVKHYTFKYLVKGLACLHPQSAGWVTFLKLW